jgi:hypothetical protein
MARQVLNPNSLAPNDKLGDTPFDYTAKLNAMTLELFAVSTLTKRVVVNALSDLPAAVSGVITLAADTLYVQANDINLSTTRLVFSANTVYTGLDSLVVTLDYVGTLPLFTLSNISGSVRDLKVTHLNAPLFSFSDTGANALRVTNVSYAGSSIGTFGGSGSGMRLTNFSGSATSGGMQFTGNWRVFIFEPTLSTIAAGSFIDLASATFDAISITETFLDYVAGSFFLSGALASANINTGGFAVISKANLKGAGTALQQVTPDDALFNFTNNNAIRDSRSDGILSLQGNAVATATGANTPTLTAGTWVVGPVGQFTGTTGGRLTYIGGKDARLPITFSASLAPTLSTGIAMSAYVAINGVVIANSRRQGTGSAGGPTSITIPWQHTFSTNDYVELFVENNTNATDILVSTAIGRVN